MKSREQVFRSLWNAHTRSWESGKGLLGDDYMRFYKWRMEWWRLIEKKFPEFYYPGTKGLVVRLERHWKDTCK